MMISMIIIEDMFVYLLSKRIRHSVIRNKVDIELKDPNMFKIKRVDQTSFYSSFGCQFFTYLSVDNLGVYSISGKM